MSSYLYNFQGDDTDLLFSILQAAELLRHGLLGTRQLHMSDFLVPFVLSDLSVVLPRQLAVAADELCPSRHMTHPLESNVVIDGVEKADVTGDTLIVHGGYFGWAGSGELNVHGVLRQAITPFTPTHTGKM